MKGVCYAHWLGEKPTLQLPPGWHSFAKHGYGMEAEPLKDPIITRGAIAGKGGRSGHLIDWEFGGPTLSRWASLLRRAWNPSMKDVVCLGVDVGLPGRVKPVGMTANSLRRSARPGEPIESAGKAYDLSPRPGYHSAPAHKQWAEFRADRLGEFARTGKCAAWALIDVQDQWPAHGGDPSERVVLRPAEQIQMQIDAVPRDVGIIIFASARNALARKILGPAILLACAMVDKARP